MNALISLVVKNHKLPDLNVFFLEMINYDFKISRASVNFNSSRTPVRVSIEASSTASAQISKIVLHCSNSVGFSW